MLSERPVDDFEAGRFEGLAYTVGCPPADLGFGDVRL